MAAGGVGNCGSSAKAVEAVKFLQDMIDVSSNRLDGLRTHCATSAELTQHEIRTLEAKLIKLFSHQIVTKAKLKDEELSVELCNIPSLIKWLQVVGLSNESIQLVCNKVRCLESLQDKSEKEIRSLLGNTREEEVRRLCCAISNLKKFTEILMKNGGNNGTVETEIPLYWDSWDRHNLLWGSPRSYPRYTRASVPSEDALLSLPNGTTGGVAFSTTPPLKRKNQAGLPLPTLINDGPPLTKSKSHESQLGVKIDGEMNGSESNHQPHGSDMTNQGRIRLPTESGIPNSPLAPCSPIRSPPYRTPQTNIQYNQHSDSDDSFKSGNLTVPRSPRTPVSRGMCHYIAHRFTKTFKMMATCDYCDKQMFLGPGLQCKECKYKCHRDCSTKVPPSCGLPPELIEEFKKKLQCEKPDGFVFHSPSSGRSPQHTSGGLVIFKPRKRSHPHQLNANMPSFPGGPDSSSNTSSCNSSTPSSPALVSSGALPQIPHTPRTPHNTGASISHNVPPPGPLPTHNRQFNFPDVKKWTTTDSKNGEGSSSGTGQGDSERTISLSGSASEDSERTPGGRTDSLDGDPLQRNESAKWPRQNSLSMKEWDIPFDELRVTDPLGTGRFFTVYRGSWHGDVAVKLLNVHNLNDPAALESFKHEVATFRKTRHENLVLFMGACMKHPRFAIVTSLCKGMTLYTHIHLRKDKFNMNKTTIIAQQISQGMGYLHARGIVHKDLKSKNIFLENGKIVITDFGLLGVTKLCDSNRTGDSLVIPPGWLCYLAPELVRRLKPRQTLHADDLPFTKESDVYAFGTVWYELLCGEWPFKGQPPEAVIWQVGKGIKQTLANLQASRDVKDILMLCWSYKVEDRPDFGRLLTTLEKLPRKRLARSPSHPVHLSRSAESVF